MRRPSATFGISKSTFRSGRKIEKTRGGVRENWNLSRLVGSTWMWRMVLLHFIVSVNGLNQQRNMAGFARFFRRSEKITPLSSVLKVICIQVISIRYNQIILHMWGTTVHIINTTHVRYYIYSRFTLYIYYILYTIYILLILHIYKLYKYNRWFVNDFPC